MVKIKINEKERKCLNFLAGEYWGGLCYSFVTIEDDTGLSRSEVRRACRSLRRKGLAKFVRGLMNDDGEVAGSGYCATRVGAAFVSPCDVCGDVSTFSYEGKLECEQHYGKSEKKTQLSMVV